MGNLKVHYSQILHQLIILPLEYTSIGSYIEAKGAMSRISKTRSRILQSLPRAVQYFVNRTSLFQAAVAERLNLNLVDLFALLVLNSGEATKPSELARLLEVPSGTASKILDRLERGGFVARSHDMEDRRGILLRVVPERIADVQSLYKSMSEYFGSIVAQASDKELRFLLSFLDSGSEASQRAARAMRNDPGRQAPD
jgi:DNA-binding MarR family transcriptional regulator